MAANGRRKRAQLALKLDINDERIPKLVGVVFLFLRSIFHRLHFLSVYLAH
ncbi:MAG: hypothetical protein IPH16_14775 [Haliscomenobacter sp.]|nr:hypothetical protein [Haliscomenobacter sp.]